MMMVVLVRCAGFMDSPRSCKEDIFFRLLLCIPYLFIACFTKTAWRWEFLGVLAFSFESHKNFNRPEKGICLSLQALHTSPFLITGHVHVKAKV